MLAYAEKEEGCRQLFLMQYFGQKEKQPCGVCDLCLGQKKRGGIQIHRKDIDKGILEKLSEKDMSVRELVRSFPDCRELVVERLRLLLDDKVVYYKTPTLLSRSEKE